MEKTRIEAGRYLARCRQCENWVEVHPRPRRPDLFFENLEAEFRCCGLAQTARFTLEKDYLDFH